MESQFVAVKVKVGYKSTLHQALLRLLKKTNLKPLQLRITNGVLYQGNQIVSSVSTDILVVDSRFPDLQNAIQNFSFFEDPFSKNH